MGSTDSGKELGLTPKHSLHARRGWGLSGFHCQSNASPPWEYSHGVTAYTREVRKGSGESEGRTCEARPFKFVYLTYKDAFLPTVRALRVQGFDLISELKGQKGQEQPDFSAVSVSYWYVLEEPRKLQVLSSSWNANLLVPSITVLRHCLKTSSNGLVNLQFCKKGKEVHSGQTPGVCSGLELVG